MAKAICYLKIQILSTKLPNHLTLPQKKELNAMGEFVSVFDSVWFLRPAWPSAAPFQNINAYRQMAQYKE